MESVDGGSAAKFVASEIDVEDIFFEAEENDGGNRKLGEFFLLLPGHKFRMPPAATYQGSILSFPSLTTGRKI